jgi:hypothetical protein
MSGIQYCAICPKCSAANKLHCRNCNNEYFNDETCSLCRLSTPSIQECNGCGIYIDYSFFNSANCKKKKIKADGSDEDEDEFSIVHLVLFVLMLVYLIFFK